MTKTDEAYVALRGRILSGELAPGEVFQQRELAAGLGMSTTPLREALRRLAAEGLVELDSHRDARVARLRAEEARDLVELRSALDPMAAALAAQRRTSAELAEMRSALAELPPLARHSSRAGLAAHRRLHRAIHLASHNELLVAALDRLWDQSDRYRLLVLADDEPTDEAKAGEHRDLVTAIAGGDAERAAAIMRAHIGTSLGVRAARRLGQ